MKKYQLKITSSNRAFFDGECESLILPTEAGEYGILADHESMVIGIEIGEMRYFTDEKWITVVTGSGFARINNNQVVILTDSVELPEEVDFNRAEEARQRAEERMMLKKSRQEYYRGKLAMTRAMARLKVKEKKFM